MDLSVDRNTNGLIGNTLEALLSSCASTRNYAESQLKAFEVVEDFGIHLASIALDNTGFQPVAMRQIASVLLHQYIDAHWNSASGKFVKPETPEEIKHRLRSILPLGLSDTESKVRTSVAFAIASIAVWDWPDDWPNLAALLVEHENVTSEFVQGSMQVLCDMSRNISSESQMLEFVPLVIPHLYRVFAEREKYGSETRLQSVSTFTRMVESIVKLGESDKDCAKAFLYPVVPSFSAALVSALEEPGDDLELRAEILTCLKVLVKSCPKLMSHYAVQVLQPVWKALTQCADFYCQGTEGSTADGLEEFIYALFNFVAELVQSAKFRTSVVSSLPDLMYYVLKYMQITDDQVAVWSSDVEKFVEDEDEESFTYSVRIAAQCMLLNLFEDLGSESKEALFLGMKRHLDDAGKMFETDPRGHWWKVHESAFLAVGVVHEFVADADSAPFLRELVDNYVSHDLSLRGYPFLHARCLWLTSRLVKILPVETARNFLGAVVSTLQPSNVAVMRVSAAAALYGFATCAGLAVDFRQALPTIMEQLLQLCTGYDEAVMCLTLEQLPHCLAADAKFTAHIEPRITSLLMDVFSKRSNDPVMASLCEELFTVLAKNSLCRAAMEEKLVPHFSAVLCAEGSPENTPAMKRVILKVLRCFVRHSRVPLSRLLMNEAFPAVVQAVLNTEDEAHTTVAGCECLQAFVSVSPEQVIGASGLQHLMHVATHLLNLRTAEGCGSVVGRLVTVMFTKCGSQLSDEHVDHLLKAVLTKMQTCQTQAVMQTLLMVFAYVMLHQLEVGINFLSAVPGPTGKSALDYVLQEWCARHCLFSGSYEIKVSTAALFRVFEHGVRTEDKHLTAIFFAKEGVPILAKIFKILVDQLAVCRSLRLAKNGVSFNGMQYLTGAFEESDNGWEDDDDDEEEDGLDVNSGKKCGGETTACMTLDQVLSDEGNRKLAQIVMNEVDGDSEEECDDPDVLADPLNAVDLEKFIRKRLQEFSRQRSFHSFACQLGPLERRILEKCIEEPV